MGVCSQEGPAHFQSQFGQHTFQVLDGMWLLCEQCSLRKWIFFFFFKLSVIIYEWASQVMLVVKNPPANAGDLRDKGSIPGSERSSRRQPTPVFLPGESHGQRAWRAAVH